MLLAGCQSSDLVPWADQRKPMMGDELVESGELESAVVEEPVEEPTPLDRETVEKKYLIAVPLSQLDEPFRLLDKKPLEFPDSIRRDNYHGEVILLVTVDEYGRVIDCQVDKADHQNVAEIIRDQIAARKFTVPMKDGQPVTAFARMPVPYRIGRGNMMKFMKETDWESSPRK
ncbi:MAG: energy transducer TonB [Puniceicoccales bacterium]